MNCPNCGKPVQGNFCTSCGTRMDQASSSGAGGADPGSTAVIRPGDLRDLAARESDYQSPGVDPGATSRIRPEDMQAMASGGPSQPPYGSPDPQYQQPYGGPGSAPGGPQPYADPGAASSGAGSNWARELGVQQQQSSYGTGNQGTGFSGLGGFNVPVPPGLQNALTPLEGLGKQMVAWIGSALLFVGTFLPSKTWSVSAGAFGTYGASRNFWDWSNIIWPLLLVLLAIASVVVAYARDYKWLWITGGVSLVILILQFLYTFSTGFDVAGVSAHPSWGWIILLPGVLLILAAAAMRSTARDAEDDQGVNKLIGGLSNMNKQR